VLRLMVFTESAKRLSISNVLYYTTLVDHRHKNMPRRESPLQSEMLQGTLDMLILRTLILGPAHGQTIAHAIEQGSEEVLQVEHGSLYPALHRLQNRGWIAAFWGTSENNRKAKYYRLTPEGRRQLATQTSRWDQVVRAIGRIMNPAPEKK
jgi:PadR family transcriptional regulator PadR